MRAMRTVSAWMSLRRPARSPVDFVPKALNVSTEFPVGGSWMSDRKFLTQASDFRADFGAKGTEVTTRVVPLRHYQRGPESRLRPGLQ